MSFSISLLTILLQLNLACYAYGDLQSTKIAQTLYGSIIGGLRKVLNIFLRSESSDTVNNNTQNYSTDSALNSLDSSLPQTLETLPEKIRRQWSGPKRSPQDFGLGAQQRYPGQLRQHQGIAGPNDGKDPRIEQILKDYRDMMNGPGSNVFHPPPRSPGSFKEQNPPHPPFYKALESYIRPGLRADEDYKRRFTAPGLRNKNKDDGETDRTTPNDEEADETPPPRDAANTIGTAQENRFTTKTTTTTKRRRTTPKRVSLPEDCDYLAYYCLKAYDTGLLCARTMYFVTHTFENYCMLDYVNCMEGYDVWRVAHMGECLNNITVFSEYKQYPYLDDYFLDQFYVAEEM